MSNPHAAVLCLSTAPLFLGCLENEETIQIDPDGSVVVRVAAKAADMADGYPVPLQGPWRPAGGETGRWLDSIGADTGTGLMQPWYGHGSLVNLQLPSSSTSVYIWS